MSPAEIQPGSAISGPEALLRSIGWRSRSGLGRPSASTSTVAPQDGQVRRPAPFRLFSVFRVKRDNSSAVTSVFRLFFGGVGPEIADFGPLPLHGPTLPREGLGKPRPGPRSICIDFQPGGPILRPFPEVF